MYWGNDKEKNTVSNTNGIILPLNRRGRVEKFKQFIPIDDRNISISNVININVLNEFEVKEDFVGRIHIQYSQNNEHEIVKIWELNETPIEILSIPKKRETFSTQNLKVFTIPLKEGVVVMAVDNRWTLCHFPISSKKGVIGETIPEISNGVYMTDCRSELIIREILPELEFFINIKDRELIGTKTGATLESGYYTTIKEHQSETVLIFQTHKEVV